MKKIQITIDADWINSLMGDTVDAQAMLTMLERYDETLYDYIDDAILEMVDNYKKEMEE